MKFGAIYLFKTHDRDFAGDFYFQMQPLMSFERLMQRATANQIGIKNFLNFIYKFIRVWRRINKVPYMQICGGNIKLDISALVLSLLGEAKSRCSTFSLTHEVLFNLVIDGWLFLEEKGKVPLGFFNMVDDILLLG